MKTNFIIILFTVVLSGYSQEDKSSYKTPHVVFEGCDNDVNAEKCYKLKLQEFISDNLDGKIFDEISGYSFIKDTIIIHTSIRYGKKGNIVPMNSKARTPYVDLSSNVNYIIQNKLPRVKPVVNSEGDTIASTVIKRIAYVLDTLNRRLLPLKNYDYIPKQFNLNNVDEVPLYSGCNEKLPKYALKNCVTNKLSMHISKNFNRNLADSLNMSSGKIRIALQFKISKTGELTEISAKGPHPLLEKEAERVLKLVPKFLKPGYFEHKPVDVFFFMPIVFSVN